MPENSKIIRAVEKGLKNIRIPIAAPENFGLGY